MELQGLVALHEVHLQGVGEEGAGLDERHVEPLADARAGDRHAHLGVELGQRPVGLVRIEHGRAETGGGEYVGDGREAPASAARARTPARRKSSSGASSLPSLSQAASAWCRPVWYSGRVVSASNEA